MTALDLTALDRALLDLVEALGVHSLEEVVTDAAGEFQNAWRDNVSDAGLVDTGRYLESISVKTLAERETLSVEVSTNARTDDGKPYPLFLEYGTSSIVPHPVALRAFDDKRRRVVQEIGDNVDRKIRSRARK